MSDYHIHLHDHEPRSAPGPEPGVYPPGHIEAYVAAAAERGVRELGFTEHLYRFVEAADVLGNFWEREPDPDLVAQTAEFVTMDRVLSLEGYVASVVDAKDRGLPVLLGLEVDFFPDTFDAVVDFLAPYPWDFLIGAVHWIGGWSLDHTGATFEFERRGVERAYEDYFELEAALADTGAVDVLAHADVVKKLGYRLAAPPIDLYERVAKAAAGSGTAVEVSSAGLYAPAAEVYPAPEMLSAFHDEGVPITLGSDAHLPEDAARGHDAVVHAARTAGYTHRLRYAARRSHEVPL